MRRFADFSLGSRMAQGAAAHQPGLRSRLMTMPLTAPTSPYCSLRPAPLRRGVLSHRGV